MSAAYPALKFIAVEEGYSEAYLMTYLSLIRESGVRVDGVSFHNYAGSREGFRAGEGTGSTYRNLVTGASGLDRDEDSLLWIDTEWAQDLTLYERYSRVKAEGIVPKYERAWIGPLTIGIRDVQNQMGLDFGTYAGEFSVDGDPLPSGVAAQMESLLPTKRLTVTTTGRSAAGAIAAKSTDGTTIGLLLYNMGDNYPVDKLYPCVVRVQNAPTGLAASSFKLLDKTHSTFYDPDGDDGTLQNLPGARGSAVELDGDDKRITLQMSTATAVLMLLVAPESEPGPDTTPPTITYGSVTTNGLEIPFVLSEPGNQSLLGQSARVAGATRGAVASWSSTTAGKLTLASPVYQNQAVTVSNSAPTNGIKDTAGNLLTAFTNRTVTNSSTVPVPDNYGGDLTAIDAKLDLLLAGMEAIEKNQKDSLAVDRGPAERQVVNGVVTDIYSDDAGDPLFKTTFPSPGVRTFARLDEEE